MIGMPEQVASMSDNELWREVANNRALGVVDDAHANAVENELQHRERMARLNSYSTSIETLTALVEIFREFSTDAGLCAFMGFKRGLISRSEFDDILDILDSGNIDGENRKRWMRE